MKGTYCLIIGVSRPATIKVGSVGEIRFEKGFYIYVGSALNSLEGRVKRHLSSNKKTHWHIDYLLLHPHARIEEVIFSVGEEKIECSLANLISKESSPVLRFGCSDCQCTSHLFYISEYDTALQVVEGSFHRLKLPCYNLKDFYEMIN